MADNSKVFDSTTNSSISGMTGSTYSNMQTNQLELFIKEYPNTKMNNDLPRVPSNQGILKDD